MTSVLLRYVQRTDKLVKIEPWPCMANSSQHCGLSHHQDNDNQPQNSTTVWAHHHGHFSTHLWCERKETWGSEGQGKDSTNSGPLVWTLQWIWATTQQQAKAGWTGWVLVLLSIWCRYPRHSRKCSNLWEAMEVILQGRTNVLQVYWKDATRLLILKMLRRRSFSI